MGCELKNRTIFSFTLVNDPEQNKNTRLEYNIIYKNIISTTSNQNKSQFKMYREKTECDYHKKTLKIRTNNI